MIFGGLDPGGKKSFGVAIVLTPNQTLSGAKVFCDSVTGVNEAIRFLSKYDSLDSVGIDAPLTWATNQTGFRPQDRYLRDRFPKIGGRVLTTNSLRRSVVVQGPAIAMRLKAMLSALIISETHPKATLFALGCPLSYFEPKHFANLLEWFSELARLSVETDSQDALDAVVSAYVMADAYIHTEAWQDLNLLPDCQDLLNPTGSPTVYYFPR